jgi:hypothetical protein
MSYPPVSISGKLIPEPDERIMPNTKKSLFLEKELWCQMKKVCQIHKKNYFPHDVK